MNSNLITDVPDNTSQSRFWKIVFKSWCMLVALSGLAITGYALSSETLKAMAAQSILMRGFHIYLLLPSLVAICSMAAQMRTRWYWTVSISCAMWILTYFVLLMVYYGPEERSYMLPVIFERSITPAIVGAFSALLGWKTTGGSTKQQTAAQLDQF